MSHIFTTQTLLASHQSFKQLLAVTCTNDICASVTKQLLYGPSQVTNSGSISLLDKQITRVSMLESKHNQIHSLVQIHQETGHVRISDRNRITRFNLINKQRNNTAAATHNITITCTANCRSSTLCSYTCISINDVLHHSL